MTWRKAIRDAAENMVSIHMVINTRKSLRQFRHIDQEAPWKYNIEENVGVQNESVNHRCCDYLSEDIGTAHTLYNLQYMARI